MLLRPPAGWEGRNEGLRLSAAAPAAVLGRGRHGVRSARVSREHARVELLGDGSVRLEHLSGTNRVRVRVGGELQVLGQGQQAILRSGDAFFLDGNVGARHAADAANHRHAFELCSDDAHPEEPAADDVEGEQAEGAAVPPAAAGAAAEAEGGAAAEEDWQNWRAWEDGDDESDDDEGEAEDDGSSSAPASQEASAGERVNGGEEEQGGREEPQEQEEAEQAEEREQEPGEEQRHSEEPEAAQAAQEEGGHDRGSEPASDVPRRASDAVSPVPDPARPGAANAANAAASAPPAAGSNAAGAVHCSQLSTGQLLDELSPDDLQALELGAASPRPQPLPPGTARPAPRQTLRGFRFVVTGVLEVLSRSECQALVERHGGVFQAGELRKTGRAAAGRTTHLIAGAQMEDGRAVETSSKYLKARCVFERLLTCLVVVREMPGRLLSADSSSYDVQAIRRADSARGRSVRAGRRAASRGRRAEHAQTKAAAAIRGRDLASPGGCGAGGGWVPAVAVPRVRGGEGEAAEAGDARGASGDDHG